ncbi:hypothetical protein PVK06_023737 [Gossypium arboreum]|uniref:RNase H type-1 domain-containing protein n=1 Tax=Gossypium arboreum TaxID=29729 RepID=A0ABR0PC44_GOSAR|nr:hypothetical protein PVK06_023737 [Gossypium arboreum]
MKEIIKISVSWAKHFSLASRQVADVETESTHGEPLAGEWTYLNTDHAVRVDSEAKTAGVVLTKVVKAIHGSVLKTSHSTLIRRIQRILFQESNRILRYIPKEQNQSADFIAKLAFREKEDLQLIEIP